MPALTHLNRGIANAKAERHNLAAHPDMGGRKSINLQRCGMQKIWALGLVSVLAGAVLVACGGGGGDTRATVYRFFNASTGAHFYTSSAAERDFVIATYPTFKYEGPSFYAYTSQAAGTSPVFRFFNKNTGAHFYTISAAERDFVIATYPAFTYEGPSWYAQTSPGGTATAMYRFFNTSNGAHFYTISAGERDFVIGTYPVFKFEGPAYYAWTTQ